MLPEQKPIPQDLIISSAEGWKNWRFDRIIPKERVACCRWEYMRESASLRLGWEMMSAVWCAELIIGQAWEYLSAMHKFEESTAKEWVGLLQWSGLFPNIICCKVPFPNPWQSLTDEQKKWCVLFFDTLHRNREPAFSRWWLDAEDDVKELGYFSIDEAYNGKRDSKTKNGFETLIARIDWRHYSNEEIVSFMRGWLKQNRPESVPGPKKTGITRPEIIDAALRDIGAMRLLNYCTVAEMKVKQPDAASFFNKLHWESKHWSAARNRAIRNFHKRLRLLPAGEKPLTAPTKGGRAKL